MTEINNCKKPTEPTEWAIAFKGDNFQCCFKGHGTHFCYNENNNGPVANDGIKLCRYCTSGDCPIKVVQPTTDGGT